MNSIPKQQEGDGSNAAAANGSRGALEQTVLGVAPSSADTTAPDDAGGRAPADAPPVTAPPVIVAAPMIAVSSSNAGAAPVRVDAPPSPVPVEVTPAQALTPEPVREPAASAESVPAQQPLGATPRYGSPPVESAAEGPQGTVLNADYLRAAREIAFAKPVSTAADAASAAGPGDGTLRAELPEEDASAGSFRPSAVPPSSSTGSSTIRGFEPVPPVRAPLAESLSGGLMAVSELGSRTQPRSIRPAPRPGGSSGGDTKARWMLLLAVAFAAIGVVSFGGRLFSRYRSTTERTRALALEAADAPGSSSDASGSAGAASRALLANRPAPERALALGRATVVSATGSVVGTVVDSTGAASGGAADTRAPAGAEGTNPQSQLAATAARHLLAGNYAEALPVYRQLAREWPENTSYSAMARLLEKRVGTVNDTRTVAPATP